MIPLDYIYFIRAAFERIHYIVHSSFSDNRVETSRYRLFWVSRSS